MNWAERVRVFMDSYINSIIGWIMSDGLRILLIIVLSIIFLRFVRMITRRLFSAVKKDRDIEFQKRADTLRSVIRYALSILVLTIAAITILGVLEIDIGPILAAAGVVGLAIGFGAQTLVQDVISGFFIFMEDQIRVGDVVEITGKSGLVEKVSLRMVVLRDLAGNVHYIRNGNIDTITNMTKEYSRYVFDIGVSYREDVDEVIEIIKQVDEGLRNDPDYTNDILEPIEILGLDKFADSAIIIKARTKTMPIQQWRVAREFNRRLKKAFDERGIEIPFPHVTLYIGEDKTGQAPPLRIVTDHPHNDPPGSG
ncbi:mechanosensitive ion channel family protein [Candidatus Latescibacterota bacterium]